MRTIMNYMCIYIYIYTLGDIGFSQGTGGGGQGWVGWCLHSWYCVYMCLPGEVGRGGWGGVYVRGTACTCVFRGGGQGWVGWCLRSWYCVYMCLPGEVGRCGFFFFGEGGLLGLLYIYIYIYIYRHIHICIFIYIYCVLDYAHRFT